MSHLYDLHTCDDLHVLDKTRNLPGRDFFVEHHPVYSTRKHDPW